MCSLNVHKWKTTSNSELNECWRLLIHSNHVFRSFPVPECRPGFKTQRLTVLLWVLGVSYSMPPFVPTSFTRRWVWESCTLLHVACCSFSWSDSIPWCKCNTAYPSIHGLMDVWIVSTLCHNEYSCSEDTVHVSWWAYLSISDECIPRNGIVGFSVKLRSWDPVPSLHGK